MIARLKRFFRRKPNSEQADYSVESSEDTFDENVLTETEPAEGYNNDSSNLETKNPGVKKLRLILYCLLTAFFLGGIGAIFGWIMINAERTIADRKNITPSVTVAVLADDETAPKNSSQNRGPPSATNSNETRNDENQQKPKTADDQDAMVGIIFPHIVEETEHGPLPIIAADGRQPWVEYSRGFKRADRKPRISIIVSNLGLSSTYTKAALELLPEDITLSFSHVSPKLRNWVRDARQKGHEVLLDVPMEPFNFPKNDPGRATLLTSSNEVENLNRLEHIMKQAGGYVGLLGTLGTKFTLHSETFLPVLKSIKQRGLIYVDSGSTSRSLGPELASSIQLPRALNNTFIDKWPSAVEIKKKLKELERIAFENKFAVGIAQPFPISIELLSAWIPTLKSKEISLAPITAIVDKQSQR